MFFPVIFHVYLIIWGCIIIVEQSVMETVLSFASSTFGDVVTPHNTLSAHFIFWLIQILSVLVLESLYSQSGEGGSALESRDHGLYQMLSSLIISVILGFVLLLLL